MMTLSPPPPPAQRSLCPAQVPDRPVRRVAAGRRLLRGLMFKELRETVPVVLMIWAAAGVITFLFIATASDGFRHSPTHAFFLMDDRILLFSCIACAASGLILGWHAYRGTQALDAWAFLIHRPISRTKLFMLRSLIGLGFYAVAMGLPMALFMLAVRGDPGARPFHWRFVLPYLADLLLGMATYFIGALVHQRQARPFASGVLPIGAAITLVTLTLWLRTFGMVATVNILGVIFCALAAGESFRTHGAHNRGGLAAKAGLNVTLLAGCMVPATVVAGLVIGWLDSQYQEARSDRQGIRVAARAPVGAWVDVLQGGRYVLQLFHEGGEGAATMNAPELLSLEGMPLAGGNPADGRTRVILDPERLSPSRGLFNGYRDLPSIFESYDGLPKKKGLYWYYLPHDGTILGYGDWDLFGGSMGPSGERDATRAPEAFPDPSPHNPLVNRHAFYYFVNGENTLEHVEVPGNIVRDGARTSTGPGEPPIICILTDQNVQVFRGKPPALAVTLPLDPAHRNDPIVLVMNPATHGYLIQYVGDRYNIGPWLFQSFDETGRLLSSSRLDAHDSPVLRPTAESYDVIADARVEEAGWYAGVGLGFSTPVIAMPLLSVRDLPYPMVRTPHLWMGMGLVHAFAAVVMLLLARRYVVPAAGKLGWIVGTLLLGPWVVITFISSHTLPLRVACPRCNRRRPVSAEHCPACGAEFPPRERSPVDIFEAAPSRGQPSEALSPAAREGGIA